MEEIQTPKKKRDPLAEHSAKSKCYSAISQHKNYYLDSKAIIVTGETLKTKIKNGANLRGDEFNFEPSDRVKKASKLELTVKQSGPGDAFARRFAIYYLFKVKHELCPEEEWHRRNIVVNISNDLGIPSGSRQSVINILRNILKTPNDELYDPNANMSSRGRHGSIEPDSTEAQLVYNALEKGISICQTAVILNLYRESLIPIKDPISWSTVERFIEASPVVYRHRRQTKKSGKDDVDSTWAIARVQQCQQFIRQLDNGEINVHAIAFWDEHHQKVRLGHYSKYETLVARNSSGVAISPHCGGIFPPEMPNTTMKYPGEARGCFGVAIVTDMHGQNPRGERMVPLNYTGRQVVGVNRYKQLKQAEMDRVKNLGGIWGKPGNGYEERYGPDWEQYLELKMRGPLKVCCITELIKHVVDESTRIYAGSLYKDSFLIFHDGLSAWWEKGAQDYLHSLGFRDRQLKCLDPTNIDNRYRNKVVGDSPEICRGLDSHGFADLKVSVNYHTALSSVYDYDDIRRFNTGTPQETWSSTARCWTVEPTSERIIEDITRLRAICQKIVDVGGAIVPDENLRHGRRARSADGSKELKNKPVSKQRIATMKSRPRHSDCDEAFLRLSNSATHIQVEMELAINEAIQMEEDIDNNEEMSRLEVREDAVDDILFDRLCIETSANLDCDEI